MRKQHLINGKHLSNPNLSVKSHVIVDKTLNVKAFALARPATVKVYTALNVFDKAMLVSLKAPSKENTFKKNTARTALEEALAEEMRAINFHYAGNVELMLTSGFEVSQAVPHQATEAPAAPEFIDLFVLPKEPGVVEFKIAKVDKCAEYVVEYREVIEGEDVQKWENVLSAAVGRVTHLKNVTQYEFRAAGVNTYTKKQDEYHFSIVSICTVQ